MRGASIVLHGTLRLYNICYKLQEGRSRVSKKGRFCNVDSTCGLALYKLLVAAARPAPASVARPAKFPAACNSMRKATSPGVEVCNRRPPCSSTMRQHALNDRVTGLVLPSERSRLG